MAWTNEEMAEALKLLKQGFRLKELAKRFERTYDAVKIALRRAGIDHRKVRLRVCRQMWSDGAKVEQIAIALRTCTKSVRTMLKKIRLRRARLAKAALAAVQSRRGWTDAEVATATDMIASGQRLHAVAGALGRSYKSVQDMIKRRGINYKQMRLDLCRRLTSEGTPPKRIARIMNISSGNAIYRIQSKVRRLQKGEAIHAG